MTYTLRPISDRTAFLGKHERSLFDTPWPKTEKLLLTEISHLRGRHLVVECDITELDIRNDGRIRASARPATPAVRVAFESIHGPLTYATDKFSHWQDNVRAIALGLEALRKVDRYGITKRGEQYAGWKALPSGSGSGSSHMTAAEAWSILGSFGDGTISEQRDHPEGLPRALRRAQGFAHPDKHDGDRSLWDQVEQAAKVLGVLRSA
jgi:hypothetical protein